MMRSRSLLLIGGVLSLAACDLAPKYTPPPLDLPTSFKEDSFWRTANPADEQKPGPWWMSYGDPALSGLEQQIDSGNPDLAVSVADFDRARAAVAEAESGLLPNIGLDTSFSANRQSAGRPLRSKGQPNQYGANTVGATASYEIDFWDRLHNTIVAGQAAAQASAADVATLRLSLEAELANDYFLLRGLEAQNKLLRDTVTAYERAYEITHIRFVGKIASGIDDSRAKAQLETARGQLSDLVSRRALIEHAIATLVGTPASGFTVAATTATAALPVTPPGLPSSLLQRRPDIAAAERTMRQANALIGVTRAAFYPNISIGLNAGFQDTGTNLASLPFSFWSVGPSAVLPLFENGLRQAEEYGALAAFKASAESYRGTVLTAIQQVEDNLALLHGLREESQEDAAAAAAAQQTADMAMKLYIDGADSYLEVIIAQSALLQAQQTAINVQTRLFQASVGLVRALGGGWSTRDLPDEPTLDRLETVALHQEADGK